jgi:hypothetical protein
LVAADDAGAFQSGISPMPDRDPPLAAVAIEQGET